MYRSNTKKSKVKSSKKKILLITLAVVLLCGGVFAVYWSFFRSKGVQTGSSPTANSETKGEASTKTTDKDKNTTGKSTDGSTTPTPASNDKTPTGGGADTPATTAVLIDPTGNFVSNHRPTGSPEMQSVCNTTSGATCTITFTKDGVTKSLPVQTTDKGGTAYWAWTFQDIGITAGSWQIQAVAKLGAQTKSASDAMTLEVR